LESARTHIVHDHVPGDVLIGVFSFHVSTAFSQNNGCFEFEIQFFEVVGHTGYGAGALDGVVVGEVEDGVLIEFGDHGNTAVSACGGHVLTEGIAIATACGLWHGGQEDIIGAGHGEVAVVACQNFGFNGFGEGALVVPIVQHIAHVDGDVWVDGVEGKNLVVDQDAGLGEVIGFEGDQFHTTKIRLFREFMWEIGFGGWAGMYDFCFNILHDKQNEGIGTGSNGLLGQKLTDLFLKQADWDLLATGAGANRHPAREGYRYETLDITDSVAMERLLARELPDVVIHTAAMTQVDDCEFKRDECVALNVTAVSELAQLSTRLGFHLVHVSTDFIFDGTKPMYTEDDAANPLSYYGWSKLEGEKRVIEHANSYSILRTVLVYGQVADMSRTNIVLWAHGTLKQQKAANVVTDQFRTPTLAEDLAMGCFLAAAQRAQGIYNIAGKDYMSVIELVERVAKFYGYSMDCINRVDSSTLNQPAKRPPITGLDINKAVTQLGYAPHSFEEGLALLGLQ
jgi:dTDP-4-dehydrorhamnose reductase